MEVEIEHAGLCLLQPFIPTFFEVLQLTDGKTFKSDESKARAIRLLDYLASGTMNFHSSAPSLSHFLCGEVSFPAGNTDSILSPEELAESEALLSALIKHWKALNHTAIDSLRDLFLKRPGILIQDRQHMLLHMSGLSIDMLLNSLPWNKNLISLPWMKAAIQVVW
ncbi:MAG: hypothetical protein RLZZ370_538 [Bacteroidota bacterium]|jgi:hypothetical protein